MEEKKSSILVKILVIIGVIACIAGIAYAVYRFITPSYLDDDEDDDFFDDFDDDFEGLDLQEE